MESSLVFTRRDAVAIISINDAHYNRMTLDFIDRLEQLATEIAADDTLRAVVLIGEALDIGLVHEVWPLEELKD